MNEMQDIEHDAAKRSLSQDHAKLDALLAELAAASARRSAPPQIRQLLLAEAQEAESSQQSSGFAKVFPGLWSGAAAAALLALAICAGFLMLSSSKTARHLAQDHASLGSGGENAQGSRTQTAGNIAGNINDESQLVASPDYVPLPYSDPSIANGTEATVRVSIPSSELIAWGVPSVEKGQDEEVPAELVLGDDGLPRAVRVLPAASSTSTVSTSIVEEIYP
jgi:hypothetical protein